MRWSADTDSYLSTGEASWSSKEMPIHSRPLLEISRVDEPRTKALIPEHMPVVATSTDEASSIIAVLLKTLIFSDNYIVRALRQVRISFPK
jgi:hypothetical protein